MIKKRAVSNKSKDFIEGMVFGVSTGRTIKKDGGRTFDWAAMQALVESINKDKGEVKTIEAWLEGDKAYTVGVIYDGRDFIRGGAYLTSSWATPVFKLSYRCRPDGAWKIVFGECWINKLPVPAEMLEVLDKTNERARASVSKNGQSDTQAS